MELVNLFKDETILSRTPSLPRHIPSDATTIEGYSSWTNSEPLCGLEKRGKVRRFVLRKTHAINCRVSLAPDFSAWEDTPNNGITLLVLAWSYILTADLAERQCLGMEYLPRQPSNGQLPTLRLDYALPQERAWWKAIAAWVSPWAVQVEDIGLDIADEEGDTTQRPPNAREAAGFLARLCSAFGLGQQCSAAIAAVLTFPLHASVVTGKPATIELPRLSLIHRFSNPGEEPPPHEFRHLGYYMSLSLCPTILGPLLWSVCWEPGVPCQFAGAWLGPIAAVLRPIIENKKLELLAKVLSFTNVAPLWLGVALCGARGIIKSILYSIDGLRQYAHTEPDSDSAAWTGIPQSFLHTRSPGPYLQKDGMVSRADVWRLRHDCYREYEDTTFEHPPAHGWPPFGRMREEDVELEIRPHLRCSHHWSYSFWTWVPVGVADTGFSPVKVRYNVA
ncbi:hypothetical protein GE09DRAFT_1208979 [Coniochaeta sp. 2T2.1]|nr:hypothetical protein GE09DRAFT_1208979 [Coniochaeta sp. 2T2.1]